MRTFTINSSKLRRAVLRRLVVAVVLAEKTGEELLALYKYDDLNRIVCRKLYKNSEHINEQHYKYDILDRIIEYQDDNQHIVVNKISLNNELLSYVIIDRMVVALQFFIISNNCSICCHLLHYYFHLCI